MHFFSEKERAEHLNRQFAKLCPNIEDHLRSGFDMITVHSDSTIFAANKVLTEFLGYTEQELIGLNAWLLFDMSSAQVVKEKLARKSEECYQAVCCRKDRSKTLVELCAENIEVAGYPCRAISARVIEDDFSPESEP